MVETLPSFLKDTRDIMLKLDGIQLEANRMLVANIVAHRMSGILDGGDPKCLTFCVVKSIRPSPRKGEWDKRL